MDWELNRYEILQIPRLNLRKCASHQYNLKFMVYQGFDLGRGGGGPAGDPVFRVKTPCGEIATDPFSNSLKPQWNAMLQIPFYEPNYTDLVVCEVWDANVKMHSRIYFSWKDIVINQEKYRAPRWIDMYERASDGMAPAWHSSLLENQAGIVIPGKGFEERSIYCGRVLLSMELEERFFPKEPSPANIALKPKDCADMWSDPMQKMFFRFQVFYGQSFAADTVLVEFTVGRKSVTSSPAKKSDKGMYELFQAFEIEMDLPFDDVRDNPEGDKKVWDPEYFVSKLPDCIVKVYAVGVFGKGAMLGMWQGPVKAVLGGGDPEYFTDNVFVGSNKDDNGTGEKYDGISQIMKAPGEEAPEPTKQYPWGEHSPDKTLSHKILNPYTGYQYVQLKSDANCELGPDDVAGFIGFSAKVWFATRDKCGSQPPKGPPILSPWAAWNVYKIPKPWDDSLQWYRFFTVRAHIYQANDLPARNETGIANAVVDVRFLNTVSQRTHTVYFTNNPTFDTTLNLNDIEVYLLAEDRQIGAEEYNPDAEDFTDVDKNKLMLKMSPMLEVCVWEGPENSQLLGRKFISPSDLFARKQNPTPIPLFRSNPDVLEGTLLASFQFIESTEKLMKEPPTPLVPDKSWVIPNDKDTWCSKAPVKALEMMDCKIQIQVIGLRDLNSPYPFGRPIFSPQVEICCDDPMTSTTTKQNSRPSGQDANFLEVVEIEVRMPVDKQYAPTLDFYVYDHSVLGMGGLPMEDQAWNAPVVAYGDMKMEQFYPDDEEVPESDDEVDEEDEEAMEKKRQKDRKKNFDQMMKELKKNKTINKRGADKLEQFYMKKDEAILQAFEQYADAPDPAKFIERVESFLLPSKKTTTQQTNAKKPEPKKADKEPEPKQIEGGGGNEGTGDGDAPAVTGGGDAPADAGGNKEGGKGGKGGKGEGEGNDAAALDTADAPGDGGLDDADAGDDDGEEGDAQEEEEAEAVLDGEAVEGEDDELPDQQEKVDTPDGKPNAEWLLLRAHPLYNCELEKSTVREYGKSGAWEPKIAHIFDELMLYRGPIKNHKMKEHETVGILKCKVKLFMKESADEAERRGAEQRYLDMAELKRNREVEYQIPDVNENYPGRDVEVRVYLLKAFQMTPLQVVDGETKSDCMVEVFAPLLPSSDPPSPPLPAAAFISLCVTSSGVIHVPLHLPLWMSPSPTVNGIGIDKCSRRRHEAKCERLCVSS
jgi:hypothetical protein